MTACGGNDGASQISADANRAALSVKSAADIQTLPACLSGISQTLRRHDRTPVDLHCAVGTYTGSTKAGSPCQLTIDDSSKGFTFVAGHEQRHIGFENLFDADGRSRTNLDDASAMGMPGIQLTHFSAAPVAVTESIILRTNGQAAAKPVLVYQRVSDGVFAQVECNFGN